MNQNHRPPAISRQLAAFGRLLLLPHQGFLLLRAPHALRWRLETFGLYMPSLPETRPWWRVNARALRALLRQLPGYAHWLGEMQTPCRGGANLQAWEEWLSLSE